MPGTNGGTGQPYWFACAKCRRQPDVAGVDRGFRSWEATGRIRERRNGGRGGTRISGSHQAEYRCRNCGHVGWSRHADVFHRLDRMDLV